MHYVKTYSNKLYNIINYCTKNYIILSYEQHSENEPLNIQILSGIGDL